MFMSNLFLGWKRFSGLFKKWKLPQFVYLSNFVFFCVIHKAIKFMLYVRFYLVSIRTKARETRARQQYGFKPESSLLQLRWKSRSNYVNRESTKTLLSVSVKNKWKDQNSIPFCANFYIRFLINVQNTYKILCLKSIETDNEKIFYVARLW